MAAASCSTLAAPCTTATIMSCERVMAPSAADTGTVTSTAALTRSPAIICRRLEYRSASAPACSESSAGGSCPRNVSQATWAVVASGWSTANTGSAIWVIEVPATLAVWPVRYRRKSWCRHSEVLQEDVEGGSAQDVTERLLGFVQALPQHARGLVPGAPVRLQGRGESGGVVQRLGQGIDRAGHIAGGDARHGEDPTAAIVDSQSVRAAANIPRSTTGWDGGKRVGGRKRHLVVDCLGLVLAVAVTAANVQDRDAAVPLLERLRILYFSVRLV